MKVLTKLALLTATAALGAAPALAVGPPTGTPIPTNTGTAHMPTSPGSQGAAHAGGQGSSSTTTTTSTPGPSASLPAKAKAYGKYCQGESKQHVAGTPGTPFSKCVTDMAKLAKASAPTPATGSPTTSTSTSATNPTTACKNESKKHVAGQHGTPFSLCVSGAAKLLKAESSSS